MRNAHPHVGRLLLWLTDAPQHEVAFKTGEFGEIAVAESLERRTAEGPAVILHDRRMPQGRGNIDHVAIAPTGVFVIDAKAHSGNVRIDSPLFGSAKLRIAGRDSTKLIDGLDRQVAAVRDALARAGHPDVTVQGVLCFTAADLPLLRNLKMRGHLLLYPQGARQAAQYRRAAQADRDRHDRTRACTATASRLNPSARDAASDPAGRSRRHANAQAMRSAG